MFASIRSRLIVIALLVIGSIYFLFPADRHAPRARRRRRHARHTVTRVPLKRGLDLQGGMHLALELDQSKQVSADPKKDLDLALTVLRKRIDEFGVEEPLVQKAGDSRIVVELAGITDPARAKAIVQRSAFLEFRITDKTNALEKALPAMDRTLRGLGIKGDTSAGEALRGAAAPGRRRPSRPPPTRQRTAARTRAARRRAKKGQADCAEDSAGQDTTPVPAACSAD